MSWDTASTTQLIADFICNAQTAQPHLGLSVEYAVSDTLAVAMAGRATNAFRSARAAIAPDLSDIGRAALFGERLRGSPVDAAFLNATACHALDFDDVNDAIKGHPSAVIIPTLVAMLDTRPEPRGDFDAAYLCALQVAVALARGLNVVSHYARGWHSTSIIGVIAATAGGACIGGLNAEQIRNALGIAVAGAAGSRANFGSGAKPVHVGAAAAHAIRSIQLAQNGLSAGPDVIGGRFGFLDLYGEPGSAHLIEQTLSSNSGIEAMGLNIKMHPCCYGLARVATAALRLAQRQELTHGEVRAVTITMDADSALPLLHKRPATGTQAQFSPGFVVASALVTKKLDLGTFVDATTRSPRLRDLSDRVQLRTSNDPPFGPPTYSEAYACIEVQLSAGEVIRCRVDNPHGHAADPVAREDLETKISGCLAHGKVDYPAKRFMDDVASAVRQTDFGVLLANLAESCPVPQEIG